MGFDLSAPYFLELENVGESALQMSEEEAAEDKHAYRVRGQYREFLPVRPVRREQSVAIGADDPAQGI
jgi:hypothetical protein